MPALGNAQGQTVNQMRALKGRPKKCAAEEPYSHFLESRGQIGHPICYIVLSLPAWFAVSLQEAMQPIVSYSRVIAMRTYTFAVAVEPDEGGYHAYCPALRKYGAVTQGTTSEEALKNINELVRMIVDELIEDNIPLPSASNDDVEVFDGARVAVTV